MVQVLGLEYKELGNPSCYRSRRHGQGTVHQGQEGVGVDRDGLGDCL